MSEILIISMGMSVASVAISLYGIYLNYRLHRVRQEITKRKNDYYFEKGRTNKPVMFPRSIK